MRAFSTPAPVDEIDEAVVIADMKKTLADSKKTVTPWAQRMITLPAQHLPENLAEVSRRVAHPCCVVYEPSFCVRLAARQAARPAAAARGD